MSQAHAIHSSTVMRLNERRQQSVLAELADEHEWLPGEHGGGTVAFMSGAHWLCGAIGCNLDSPLTPEGARHVFDYVASRGGRPRLDLTDQSGKAAFKAVAGAGFVLDHAERVLARDLAEPVHLPNVPGLSIERLNTQDHADVLRHARHTIAGFTPAGQAMAEGEIESAVRAQMHERSRGFWAIIDGQSVATCGMEVVAIAPEPSAAPVRVASLWGAVVAEPFRRRGIQRALIAHRLKQGVAEGCALAVIECEPGIPTERNAQRLGFALAYTRLAFKAPANEGSPARDG